jgi:replicative DNA helicase
VFLVAIDYLQLMKTLGRFQNRNAEVSEITRALKLLAVEEDVSLHLLSQLSRDNMREKRPPALHDLRDSGSIEQDADAVAFVWRPEMLHRDREDLRGLAELILAKQRNGPVGKLELTWLPGFTKFESPAEGSR